MVRQSDFARNPAGTRIVKINVVDSSLSGLSPWLIGYLGAESDNGDETVRRVIPARPNSFVQIILEGSHDMIDVESGERHAVPAVALFGPLTHYRYDMVITGRLRTFSVRLQPAAAGQLFGFDPVALVDRFVPIELPGGLHDRLAKAADWSSMTLIADGWLDSLARGKPATDAVAQAACRMRERHGQAEIHELADSSGVSLRHFQRRFRVLMGLNPKLYARICRISHAVHRKQLMPQEAWTSIALEAGYSDQSHFIRDFRALTGVPPKDFLRGQTPIERHPRWQD